MRHKRMRGIADQRHAAFAPTAERRTVEQSPALTDGHGRNHLHDGRMPVLEEAELFALAGGHDPVAYRPRRWMTLDQQEILVAFVPDGVVQQMAAGPDPELNRLG